MCRGRDVQGTDVVVAQRVVDVLELAAGGGHDGDVVAALGGDLLPERAQDGVLGQELDRFDHGPADQGAALFGDAAAVHGGVGLVVARGQSGPAGQLARGGESVHVADLGDQ